VRVYEHEQNTITINSKIVERRQISKIRVNNTEPKLKSIELIDSVDDTPKLIVTDIDDKQTIYSINNYDLSVVSLYKAQDQ